MSRKERISISLRPVVIAGILLAGLGVSINAAAQKFQDLQTPKSPLVLKAKGSFFVGGEKVQQTKVELGNLGPDDQVTINQMYVEYMIPVRPNKVPVILLHGATLSGKTYDTTPDGRMGWFEYFVRKGHPVYVPDQVGRARSGFNQAIFNNVRAGSVPPSALAATLRLGDNVGSWTNFRFGPTPGNKFPDTQFPVEAVNELSKQDIPDLNAGLPAPNPGFKAYSELSNDLGGAVFIGHSQGARQPTPAALIDPKRFKGLVLIEPGNCTTPTGTELTDEEISKLATLPILVMFADNLEMPTGLPLPPWSNNFKNCQDFAARIKKAGGNIQMIHTPELGIRGNSHMIMQDRNNLQIADLIMKWIDKNVKTKVATRKSS